MEQTKKKLALKTTIFLIATPIIGVIGTGALLFTRGIPLNTWLVYLFMTAATGLAITGGYHRLFSHRAYKASLPVKLFYILFGAAAFQQSVIEWSSDHRIHHRFVDKEEDPYAITKGFWYAHILWLFENRDHRTPVNVNDLYEDKWVKFQDDHYYPIAIFMGFLFPTLLCALWGDALGGLLLAGSLRIAVNHHMTFFINSLAHYKGDQPFSDKHTAKDNWLIALFTFGEGYHNFHHEFQADYRNGIRWFDYDPTKWLINTFAFFGLASDRKTISEEQILRKKMVMEEKALREKLESKSQTLNQGFEERLEALRNSVQESQARMINLKSVKEEAGKKAVKEAESEYKVALNTWKRFVSGDLAPV
ncbi:acyl-CoA desaturase [Leptospira selangorensis]|uniref:Acyl-CoA desaturase n=1 Tax=Leptospira selangorensis TaxID=2484982 RepID=A0A5F2C2W1_9LEPT|nr:acyl-CoA desaturase [Leptospira selangorensis]TGM17135.1 acyl-CoA desaturase [Leptospira selangorensis]TGM21489.1 acyl-CoA desaturase [Leptospira selangorensis]